MKIGTDAKFEHLSTILTQIIAVIKQNGILNIQQD